MILQSLGGGLLGAASQAAVLAGSLVLVLALVAFGAFAYKQLLGDGVEWPDEGDHEDEGDAVRQGDGDDEWKYY